MLEGSNAALDFNTRRPANHDGAPSPRRGPLYFRLEDHIPENHLLRLVDKHISFEFVRAQLKDSYSATGRPSVDPELLLRILLIAYPTASQASASWWRNYECTWPGAGSRGLGSIRGSRIYPTFSKNRHGRFQESSCSSSCFEQIVRHCVDVGLVQGQHLFVDGSFVVNLCCFR